MPADVLTLKIESDALAKKFGVKLNEALVTSLAAAGANAIASGIQEFVPMYPAPSGKPLPAIYPFMTKAVYRKRKDGTKVLVRPPMSILSKWKTEKQRRYFFWALREGIIEVPYSRTGLLGQSINGELKYGQEPGVVYVTVGTKLHYAKYVIGNDSEQAAYHKGTWWQLETELAKQSEEMLGVARYAVVRRLKAEQAGG